MYNTHLKDVIYAKRSVERGELIQRDENRLYGKLNAIWPSIVNILSVLQTPTIENRIYWNIRILRQYCKKAKYY